MNANEIRAAAERLIVELEKVNHPLHGLSPVDALGLKLARAVLSEHPASGPSDGEILDWLEEHEATDIANFKGQTIVLDEFGNGIRDAIRKAM